MAKDLNKVMIIGRLGADPELRYTPQGAAVCTMRVASGRSWRDSSGEPHEETEWFRVVAWEKLGEVCNQFLTKGSRVYFEGRLKTNRWQDKDGIERFTTEVQAVEMILLEGRSRDAAAPTRDPGRPEVEPADDEVFNPPPRAAAPPPSAQQAARVPGVRRSAAGAVRTLPQAIDNDEDLPF